MNKKELSTQSIIRIAFSSSKLLHYLQKKNAQIGLLLLCVLLSSSLIAQENYTLSGYVKEAESGETLIGATVYEKTNGTGITTNIYGFYSLTLPKGTYEITYSYVGLQPMIKTIDLVKNIELDVELINGQTLDEVVVTAESSGPSRHQENRMSTTKLSMSKVEALPVLMGERDVIKIVQLLPGVQSGSEGSSGLYVRGGGPDQNLLLLDGVPIYNANHLFGFMSVFNGDAIKSAEVIKGGFPARYGGRLSSVLDIRMKEGNLKKIQGSASVGLISGKFNLEGPIIKDKTSFNISGRRTWIDLLTTPIQKQRIKKGKQEGLTKYHFYDLNIKVNHQFAPGNRLYLSGYLGDDKMSMLTKNVDTSQDEATRVSSEDASLKWGNKIFALRWNKQLNPKLFSNTTLTYSQYKFNLGIKSKENELNTENPVTYDLGSFSEITDYTAKVDFDYIPTNNHYIRFGAGVIYHQFKPTVISEKITEGSTNVNNTQGGGIIKGNEYYGYIEDDMAIGARVKINPGLHFAAFSVNTTNYTSFQPRVAASFLLNDKSSIKVSYSKMNQFIHLLSSPGLGLPTDLWVPSTKRVKPESAEQYGIAYTRSLPFGLEMNVEGFYKTMSNLLEYKDGISVFGSSQNWQDKVVAGKGTSYGAEFLLEKKQGNTTGWIGYTLSWSNRTVPGLNFGKAFPYKYDRRHDISAVITHKFSERIDIGAVWVYGTGLAYTLPTQVYQPLPEADIFQDFEEEGEEGEEENENTDPNIKYIGSRNNQRVPTYHRLDLSVNLHKELKWGERSWSFGVYNAYNRKNPFSVSALRQANGTTKLQQTSLIPVLPYFSYHLKF